MILKLLSMAGYSIEEIITEINRNIVSEHVDDIILFVHHVFRNPQINPLNFTIEREEYFNLLGILLQVKEKHSEELMENFISGCKEIIRINDINDELESEVDSLHFRLYERHISSILGQIRSLKLTKEDIAPEIVEKVTGMCQPLAQELIQVVLKENDLNEKLDAFRANK